MSCDARTCASDCEDDAEENETCEGGKEGIEAWLRPRGMVAPTKSMLRLSQHLRQILSSLNILRTYHREV